MQGSGAFASPFDYKVLDALRNLHTMQLLCMVTRFSSCRNKMSFSAAADSLPERIWRALVEVPGFKSTSAHK